MPAIRLATVADAPALGALQMAALLSGYTEFLDSTETLPGVADRVAWWRVELEQPDARAWIAEHEGTAAGLASVGPRELRWLCVMPERWGGGIGTALLATAEVALERPAQVEVPEGNLRIRRLLERRGWQQGPELGQREGRVSPEVRYELAGAAPGTGGPGAEAARGAGLPPDARVEADARRPRRRSSG